MKRILTCSFLVLVACEGEPPKTPIGPAVIAPAEAQEGEPTAPVTAAKSDAVAAPAGTCACCPCNAPDGGAGGGGSEAVAVVPAAPVTASKLSGVVVTVPAAAAAHAVVYIEDAPIEPNAKMSAAIDNRGMAFIPFITVIPVGGRVVFHDSDPFPHNVFSPDADKFNMGTISQGQSMAHVFKEAGGHALLCNLHPGMLGYVVVSPSSYFAKADAHGRYTIKDVPAGTYKVTAWAPRQTPLTQPITVKGSSDATLDFELHR